MNHSSWFIDRQKASTVERGDVQTIPRTCVVSWLFVVLIILNNDRFGAKLHLPDEVLSST